MVASSISPPIMLDSTSVVQTPPHLLPRVLQPRVLVEVLPALWTKPGHLLKNESNSTRSWRLSSPGGPFDHVAVQIQTSRPSGQNHKADDSGTYL